MTITKLWRSTLLRAGLLLAMALPSFGAYVVTINTQSISGTAGFIDLTLAAGDDALSIAISSFSPTGILGAVDGTSFGDFAGDLTSGNTLTIGPGNTDYLRAVTFGASIQFMLSLSGPAVSSPNPAAFTGNTFRFFVFDTSFAPLLTVGSGPDPEGYLFAIDVAAKTGATDITPFGARGILDITAAVPEPMTLLLSGAGLAALFALRKRVA